MPSKSNVEMLEKANASFEQANGVFLVDYRGLTVKEAQEVRHAIREAGGEMKVYKNNIVRLALEKNELPNLDEYLSGQIACVFYHDDPAAVAKAIKEEGKKLKKLEPVAGISDGKAIDAAGVQAIADLPSRDQLLSMLLNVMLAPMSGMARVTAGPISGFLTATQAIADQKDAA